MTQFLFEVEFKGAIRYEAPTAWEAISRLRDQLDVCDANLGAWDWGDPILCEIGITDRRPVLVEADGKPVLDGDTARGLNAFGESALCTNASEPDTSDIPEARPAFWQNAKLARPPHLDPRELGTVLAALRYWQREMGLEPNDYAAIHSEIASDGGTLEPLTADEIDALCERLNVSSDPLSIPSAADLRKSRLADAGEDMLAALECAEEFLSNDPRNDPGDGTLGVIRDAIAKAKGEATEAPAAQLAPQTVWALVIDHKHGTDVTVHRTREDAIANGAAYARSWWDDVQSDGDKAPDPDEEAFDLYFQRQAETGDEWYRLEECAL